MKFTSHEIKQIATGAVKSLGAETSADNVIKVVPLVERLLRSQTYVRKDNKEPIDNLDLLGALLAQTKFFSDRDFYHFAFDFKYEGKWVECLSHDNAVTWTVEVY